MFLYITVTMNVNSDAMADNTRLYADNYISLPKYNNLGRFRKSILYTKTDEASLFANLSHGLTGYKQRLIHNDFSYLKLELHIPI